MKKIFAVITAVVIMASFGLMMASAADEKLALTVSSASGAPGDKVTLTVSVTKNPGITALKITPALAADAKATFTGAAKKGITEGGLFEFDITKSKKIVWANAASVTDKKEFVVLEFTIATNAAVGTVIPVSLTVDDSLGADGKTPVQIEPITAGDITVVAPTTTTAATTTTTAAATTTTTAATTTAAATTTTTAATTTTTAANNTTTAANNSTTKDNWVEVTDPSVDNPPTGGNFAAIAVPMLILIAAVCALAVLRKRKVTE